MEESSPSQQNKERRTSSATKRHGTASPQRAEQAISVPIRRTGGVGRDRFGSATNKARQHPGAFRRTRLSAASVITVATVLLGVPPGCMTTGKLLYVMGLGHGPKVEAQFHLTDEPVMIFVDDIHERVDWPPAERYIFDELSQALLRHKAAKKIIPLETIDQLRQTMDDFNKRGCREIGERAGATQVLWLEVRDFLADEQILGPNNAAYITVSVKVIDVTQQKSRSRVRLWPVSPAGSIVSVSLSGAEASEAKSKDGISKRLAAKLAESVARLFYDHRGDDFEHASH